MRIARALLLGLGGLVAVAAVVLVALLSHGWSKVHDRAVNPVRELRVRPDPSLIPRGRHLADVLCAPCHAGPTPGVLAGNRIDYGALPGWPSLGSIRAPDLARGGVLGSLSDGELARVIREGLDRDARPLLRMRTLGPHLLSDRDLAALIAYLRAQPAGGRPAPARRIALPGYLMLGTHLVENSQQLPVELPAPDVPMAPDSAQGAYATAIYGCRECHGKALHGLRPAPLSAAGGDLVAFARAHPPADFSAALHADHGGATGRLDAAHLPWPDYREVSDVEARAIWVYLRTQP